MPILPKSKPCTVCGEVKKLSDFYNDQRATDGKRSDCKTCTNKKNNQWRQANPERNREWSREYYRNLPKKKRRDSWLFYKHGITVEQYEILHKKQHGKCAICGGNNGGKSMHVDHDHKTGVIRGLLCGKCNRAIGYANDDPAILQSAIAYLKRSR